MRAVNIKLNESNQRFSKYHPDFIKECCEMGREFENYVVSKFSQKYFELLEWRGDKFYDGVYPRSNRYPDMEWMYESFYDRVHFGIECKYRTRYQNFGINWAKESKLETYRDFQIEKNMAVFVIIGIGGKPIRPSEVFVIPLKHISAGSLYKNFLNPYRRENPEQHFFLDLNSMTLK